MAGLLSLVMLLLALMTMTSPAKAADREAEERIKQAEMALNSEEYEKAARLFAESRELSQQLEMNNRALYWEAFSRYRLQETQELKIATELLDRIDEDYAELETIV